MNGADSPIFVGGLAHSGKTQLRLVLEAHPDIAMTRRTYMWHRFYGRFGDLRQPDCFERALATMAADPYVAQLSPDADQVRRDFYAGPLDYAHLIAIFHRHHAERLGCRRWGDQLKSIERYADVIFRALPGSRMVHMVRDPRTRRAAARRPARPGALGWETAKWVASADLAERNQARYGERYRVVAYESLVRATSETIAELCAWLGEDYTSSMRERVAALSFDPPDAIERPPLEASFLDSYAGPSIAALGYERTLLPPRRSLAASSAPAWGLNRLAMVTWNAVRARRDRRIEAT